MTRYGTRSESFTIPVENIAQVMALLNEAADPEDGMYVSVMRPLVQASAPHATEIDVLNQVDIGLPINDSAAAAIASWYQSPHGHGLTFVQLGQGQPVPVDELLDAIEAELSQSIVANRPELEALARWAEGVEDD